MKIVDLKLNRVEYVFYVDYEEGQDTSKFLPKLIGNFVTQLPDNFCGIKTEQIREYRIKILLEFYIDKYEDFGKFQAAIYQIVGGL